MKEKSIPKQKLPTKAEVQKYFEEYKAKNNYQNELKAEEFLAYMKKATKLKEITNWESLARIWIRYTKKSIPTPTRKKG